MNAMSFVAVGVGAALGAWLRWGFGLWFSPLAGLLPMGTLVANLLGAFLIGAAVATFHHHVDVSPEVRLFVITGFLGGLTTFSSFSAEVVALFQRAEYGWAVGTISLHLFGSLLMTVLGILCIQKLTQ
jgi:fluoride exporter